jgi:P-type E1-E2 ATPase
VSSKIVIQLLKKMSVDPVMVTQDSREVAQAVARKVGITTYCPEQQFLDKDTIMSDCRKRGGKVALVVHGKNDIEDTVPADITMVMNNDLDLSVAFADIVFLKKDTLLIPKIIGLAKTTIRHMYQNMGCAFFCVFSGLLLASGVLYSYTGIVIDPIVAGFLMVFSHFFIIRNSFRFTGRMEQ